MSEGMRSACCGARQPGSWEARRPTARPFVPSSNAGVGWGWSSGLEAPARADRVAGAAALVVRERAARALQVLVVPAVVPLPLGLDARGPAEPEGGDGSGAVEGAEAADAPREVDVGVGDGVVDGACGRVARQLQLSRG